MGFEIVVVGLFFECFVINYNYSKSLAMKHIAIVIIAFLLMLPLVSFEKGGLVNKPMPVLPDKTLDGKIIDENYFKGHITLVAFMYIGCPYCMREISMLNRLKKEYANNDQVQILCIARQMRRQMEQFNSVDSSMYSKLRVVAFNVPPMEYTIQPACGDGDGKMEQNGEHATIKSECSTLEDTYGVTGFPTAFYVDRKGLIREIHKGGPRNDHDEDFYKQLKKNVDKLLNEK